MRKIIHTATLIALVFALNGHASEKSWWQRNVKDYFTPGSVNVLKGTNVENPSTPSVQTPTASSTPTTRWQYVKAYLTKGKSTTIGGKNTTVLPTDETDVNQPTSSKLINKNYYKTPSESTPSYWSRFKSLFTSNPGPKYVDIGPAGSYANLPESLTPGERYKVVTLGGKAYVKTTPSSSFPEKQETYKTTNEASSVVAETAIPTSYVKPGAKGWYVRGPEKRSPEGNPVQFDQLKPYFWHLQNPYHSKKFEQQYNRYYGE